MDQAHKQRLVGAVVLAALGLIFIPMILDFSQDEPNPLSGSKIPEEPNVMKMEVMPLDVWSEPIDPEIDSANRIVETPAPDTRQIDKPAASDQQVETSAPADVQKPQKSAPVVEKQVVKPVIETTPEAPAGKPAVPGGASAWVVQVASFTEESKAFTLRDNLRKAGHPVFIERYRSVSETIYRVKVGPVLLRSEADQLKKQIANEVKLDGLVMKYQ